LPWELWGPQPQVEDDKMSDIYGHIMFAGAGLLFLLCIGV
jgi:hypothetical protein